MTPHLGQPLTEQERHELRAALERVGEERAHEESGVSRHSLVRCVSGLRVQPGTTVLVRAWLVGQRPEELRVG